MKIEQLKVKNLNGFINHSITFDPDLTFLIGMNGSGKTSVLKLLIGLLKPSYKYLNEIAFDKAELVCSSDGKMKDIKITCSKMSETVYEITFAQKNKQEKLIGHFDSMRPVMNDPTLQNEVKRERLIQNTDNFQSQDPVKKIFELVSPAFLGLERRTNATVEAFHRSFGARRSNDFLLQQDQLKDSITDIQTLIFDYFRLKAEKQPQIAEDFRNNLVSKYFEFQDTSNARYNSPLNADLEARKIEILSATKALGLAELGQQIENFFSKMISLKRAIKQKQDNVQPEKSKHIAISIKDVPLYERWFLNSPQLARIDKVLEISNEYQRQIENLNEPVRRFESIVNEFFKEGKKKLEVTGTGQIRVQLPNQQISSIRNLSSGEKQVIIMIASLIFYNKDNEDIFIIDEPEVSLHLAWQELFVEAIRRASPNTQFILATHSPSVIGSINNEKYCRNLSF